MIAFISYEIKVSLLTITFYLLYSILMRQMTWFKLRRFILLSSLLFSFILPFCVIIIHKHKTISNPELLRSCYIEDFLSNDHNVWSVISEPFIIIIFYIIIIGSIVLLTRTIINLIRLRHLLKNLALREENGIKIYTSEDEINTFSFFNIIVMSSNDYDKREKSLFEHEFLHIKRHHCLDLLFVDICKLLQWFNPFIWLIQKELRHVHEFEADEWVLHSGISSNHYLRLLMEKATLSKDYSLANTFCEKTSLKCRFEMLAHPRSPKTSVLKSLFMVPVVLLSLLLSSKSITNYTLVQKRTNNHYSVKATNTSPFTLPLADSTIIVYNNNDFESTVNDKYMSNVKSVNIKYDSDSLQNNILPAYESQTYNVAIEDTIIEKIDDETYLIREQSVSKELDTSLAENTDSNLKPLVNNIQLELSVNNNHSVINTQAFSTVSSTGNNIVIIQAYNHLKKLKTNENLDYLESEELLSMTYDEDNSGIVRLTISKSD